MDHARELEAGDQAVSEELPLFPDEVLQHSLKRENTLSSSLRQALAPHLSQFHSHTSKVRAHYRSGRARYDAWRDKASEKLENVDLTPDLASEIGSKRWFRGLGTMVALGAIALAFWPDFAPLEAMPAMELDESARDEFRSQMITPLALGAESGRQTSATSRVIPLKSAPERPQIELVATLSSGDSFMRMLQRAGVGTGEAEQINAMVSGAMPLEEIEKGTRVDLVLGRRPQAGAPRPLDELAFRARFDLELEVFRDDAGQLALKRNVIRVDDTPLRIRGTVGQSLYRSARAAGAPTSAVQEYIKALDGQIDLDRSVASTDTFDMIISYRRAATGERQAGKLLYAGIDRNGEAKTQLMRWGDEGRFYEASGVGEQRNGLVAPVPGRITSSYGMRRHPILGYRRMHSGMDFKAGYGTPIVAVSDGRVSSAGRAGGCGNAVRITHGGGLSTRYCHMSRMAVRSGQNVRRGQVIGYVGSTGLSTGAHLHYEMYRGGRAINPAGVRFVTRAQLEGRELMDFRATLRRLKQVEAGAALADLEPKASEIETPRREIEKLDQKREIG
ncbi:peptidoglycan DD-metalloendopeptidase family protein [Altererythrobacter arenosus]|uniref:Peptidoglycan DD-metalloendopeptidase family protein n=1 Tax=Altererythrobacter arenosus TaxID=3032592 RepID=A0ABY8FX95_9SPHN|nr:M23 family metallopeptidase [Altererythrobacter sp. CAU 1644]WFL78680.1 peptidoglycan DD-metalloendopeptidase family protein [Altererythrobacter sp. CAU 1644]